MIRKEIKEELLKKQDKEYRDFQIKLIPTVKKESMIGVRTPIIKAYAKELYSRDDIDVFLNDLPHQYFDENQLHAFIISNIKDYDKCINEVNKFLPYIDNWATCDQLSPTIFKKNKDKLLKEIDKWLEDKHIYTRRFAIELLMSHYLDESFDINYANYISDIKSDEYYLKMMIAWYFSFALVKKYDEVIGIIEAKKMDKWVQNKTIQKAVESYRITDDKKAYLKTLKIK